MPQEKLTFNNLGLLAKGGIATLDRIVLQDGRHAIFRQLQPGNIFSIKQQKSFRRGVRIRAMLSPHPNLASTLEICLGCLRPYEIVEYVEGKNLKVLMNDRNEAIRNNLPYVINEAAEGLAWIHRNGFMHLDVKPENVLVNVATNPMVIKLTDFDLAQKADWNAPHRQMGTKAYMAPEQFNEHTAYQASDVFAFSIMTYQLVTGRDPFPGDTQKQSLRRQASTTYMPKQPAELVPGINPKLNALIMTGLEKRRERRFPNMMAFLDALRKAQL